MSINVSLLKGMSLLQIHTVAFWMIIKQDKFQMPKIKVERTYTGDNCSADTQIYPGDHALSKGIVVQH